VRKVKGILCILTALLFFIGVPWYAIETDNYYNLLWWFLTPLFYDLAKEGIERIKNKDKKY
jgi:accessory gene regulator protein AgrB